MTLSTQNFPACLNWVRSDHVNPAPSAGPLPQPIDQSFARKLGYVFTLQCDASFSRLLSDMDFETSPVMNLEMFLREINSGIAGCLIIDLDEHQESLGMTIQRVWDNLIAFPVIVVSTDANPSSVANACRSGASAFLEKPLDNNELRKAVNASLARDQQGSPSPYEVRQRVAKLTPREREILSHCLTGTTAKSIAKRLDITYQTVDKHRSKAQRKLGVGSLLELSNLIQKTIHESLGRQV